MQDFGDELLYKVANESPHLELRLYRIALMRSENYTNHPLPKKLVIT